jgi:hypothetical protein
MKALVPIILIGVLIAGLGGGVAVASYRHYKQRGIRNDNPGNIERGKTKWVGMRPIQTDSRYLQFENAEYGIRALYKTLLTYRNSHGLTTIRGIINRWAPPNENDTASYIAGVAKALKISADTPLTTSTQYMNLIKSITRHENGVMPYSDAEILKGMRLAVTS